MAFKPDIDDLRESPALGIAQKVAELGCSVQIVEPNIDVLPKSLGLPNVELVTLEEALVQSDAVCVLVKHKTFIKKSKEIRAKETVIDAVGLLG